MHHRLRTDALDTCGRRFARAKKADVRPLKATHRRSKPRRLARRRRSTDKMWALQLPADCNLGTNCRHVGFDAGPNSCARFFFATAEVRQLLIGQCFQVVLGRMIGVGRGHKISFPVCCMKARQGPARSRPSPRYGSRASRIVWRCSHHCIPPGGRGPAPKFRIEMNAFGQEGRRVSSRQEQKQRRPCGRR